MAVGQVAREILAEMQKAAGKKPDASRTQLVKQPGQILIVNKNTFIGVLKKEISDAKDNPDACAKIWNQAHAFFINQSGNPGITRSRKVKLLNELKKIPVKRGDYKYIIHLYKDIQDFKAKGGQLQQIIKKELPNASLSQIQRIGGGGRKGAQLGHAEEGTGLSGAGLTSLRAQAVLEKSGQFAERTQFMQKIQELSTPLNLKITHSKVISNNKLDIDFVPILTWQAGLDNNDIALQERQAVAAIKRYFRGYATAEGSTPLIDTLAQTILFQLAPNNKKIKATGKNAKKRRRIVKESSSINKNTKIKTKSVSQVIRDVGISTQVAASVQKERARKQGAGKGASNSPLALLALINSKLPNQIAGNMGAPALENQTGRLAESFKMVDVNQTKEGYYSFGYTYQTEPYQIFEVGAGQPPWATSSRDPRKLAEKSIREIAAQFAVGRFYLRRL